jgi:hypothetical protein
MLTLAPRGGHLVDFFSCGFASGNVKNPRANPERADRLCGEALISGHLVAYRPFFNEHHEYSFC